MFDALVAAVLLAHLIHHVPGQTRRARDEVRRLPRHGVHGRILGPVAHAAAVVAELGPAEDGVVALDEALVLLADHELGLRWDLRRERRQSPRAGLGALPANGAVEGLAVESLLDKRGVVLAPDKHRGGQHGISNGEQHVGVIAHTDLAVLLRDELRLARVRVLRDALHAVVGQEPRGAEALAPLVDPGLQPNDVELDLGVHPLHPQLEGVDRAHGLAELEGGHVADFLREAVALDVPGHDDPREVASLVDPREHLRHVGLRQPSARVHERHGGIAGCHVERVPLVVEGGCEDHLHALLDPPLHHDSRLVRPSIVIRLVCPLLVGRVPALKFCAKAAHVGAPLRDVVAVHGLELAEEAVLEREAGDVVLEGPAEVVRAAHVQEADFQLRCGPQRHEEPCIRKAVAVEGEPNLQDRCRREL
mmetsp:Transcript_59326/g.154200  ORF Transcript_59326/g.154200 Transcript_59326/m.154200 type:complete len:420 (+) Transcript_59326:676-1935(+)